jgi:hypothetical protein
MALAQVNLPETVLSRFGRWFGGRGPVAAQGALLLDIPVGNRAPEIVHLKLNIPQVSDATRVHIYRNWSEAAAAAEETVDERGEH